MLGDKMSNSDAKFGISLSRAFCLEGETPLHTVGCYIADGDEVSLQAISSFSLFVFEEMFELRVRIVAQLHRQ